MNVIFSGKYAVNPHTFGINFEAIVDGQTVICSASIEALQDIDPSNVSAAPVQQFLANQSQFQAIAEAKIRSGAVSPIGISSADVSA